MNRLLPDFLLNLMKYDLIWFFKLKEKGLITFFFVNLFSFFFLTVTLVFLLSWMVRTSTSLSYHHFSFSDFFSLYSLLFTLCICLSSISHFYQLVLSLLQFCLSFFYFPFKSFSGFFLCVHNSCLYFKCLFIFFFCFYLFSIFS